MSVTVQLMSGDIYSFSIENKKDIPIQNILNIRISLASIINQYYNFITIFEKVEDEFIEINEKILKPGDHYYAIVIEKQDFYFKKDPYNCKYSLFDKEGNRVYNVPSRSIIYVDYFIDLIQIIESVIKYRKEDGYEGYDSDDENFDYDDLYDSITTIEAIDSYIKDILKINIDGSVISLDKIKD